MKQLKQKPLLHLLLLLMAISLGLTACSGDDFAGGDDIGMDGERFSVGVTDGGYTSVRNGIHTKAMEQGYATEFTANDRIGIFAVKNNQIITEVNNLCLTASTENNNLVWKDAGGEAPLKFSGATYYAYYPYQTTLTGNVDPMASDADDFFAGVANNWVPSTNQGTYIKYTAQDLMVAKGNIGSNGLSFGMEHQMALVVIELPGTKYEFSNTNPSVSDYITDPLDIRFDNYSPCKMTDGTYRYLVNPNSSPSTLTGGYANASGAVKGWGITASIGMGKYKTYKVDGGVTNVISHHLQTGDFMLKNGTLMQKDTILDAIQQSNCIGVVFWVGCDTNGGGHGKIVSLNQENNVGWGDNNIDEQTAEVEGIRNSSDGYLGTFNLISRRKGQPNFPTTYGAFNWIYQKNNNDVNGTWYMPAIDELKMLYNIQGTINPKITSAGGVVVYYYYYLSSSEYASNGAYILDMEFGTVHSNPNSMSKNAAPDICVRGIAKF